MTGRLFGDDFEPLPQPGDAPPKPPEPPRPEAAEAVAEPAPPAALVVEPPDRTEEAPYEDAPAEVIQALGGRPPTMQQWRAISTGLEPCSIVAGAGSGKTAVMAARVVYLALVASGRLEADHPGARPSRVLCLTFTNKAAEELFRRVQSAVAGLGLPEGEEATVLTYHAFAARLLDDEGLRAGLEPGSMLLTEAQKWQVVSSVLAEREFEHLEVRSLPHVIGYVLGLADECQNHLRTPEEVVTATERFLATAQPKTAVDREMVEAAERRVELAETVAAYRDRKRELGAIDYGDQIRLAVDLVQRHSEVAAAFRDRYGVVLLDEYQDTNVAQGVLLRALTGPGFPVTAVGDPDQNIYAWRGASLANIVNFATDYPRPDGSEAEAKPLYVNFRSGSRILAVADAVVGGIDPAHRPPGKRLWSHESRGEGRVLAFAASDEESEARHIARLIREEVELRPRTEDGEPSWGDVAVLCRKRRLFPRIAAVLREEGVPAEVVDLGGLLKMPEVVDVVAWLRVIEDPARNVALTRILQGPRWRIGYRDLAALARWSARHNSSLTKQLEEVLQREVDRPGDVAFALGEALDHLDDEDMTSLSDEARARLLEFAELLRELRAVAAGGSLADLVQEVVERSGLLRELEAADTPASVSARRNLLNLIDHVAAFAPVEGEASLATLVQYLDIAEEQEDELEPAQPSESNTVKLLTIHKAKGLEWPIVLVPGLAGQSRSMIFPDVTRQPNPVKQPAALPFELRGDASLLPVFTGNITKFRNDLKERGLEEERRLAYVALTRAKDLLVVSTAGWYEGPADPFEPSGFFEEIAATPACEELFREEVPEENPLIDLRREQAGEWPVTARPADSDDVFPDGWHQVAEHASADPAWARARAADDGAAAAVEFDEALARHEERAALVADRTRPAERFPVPTTLSVSSLVDYVKCPKLFFWSVIRPLPRRPSDAARLGSEIHRWIELQSRGQASLLDLDDTPDLSVEERLGEPGRANLLRKAFQDSRFAGRTPYATERPFLLWLDGMVVGGRIDAIFDQGDGRWEVVDYKTGRVPDASDPITGLQLDLYSLACAEVWGKRPEDLTLTYLYLSTGEEVTRPAGDTAEVRQRVVDALRRIAVGEFEASPGRQCRWCDFLAFCEPGKAFVAANETTTAGIQGPSSDSSSG
jgi:DNA helicase-2/ATP-dependent DNA helicase PcrA